jgi:hypothetical protein
MIWISAFAGMTWGGGRHQRETGGEGPRNLPTNVTGTLKGDLAIISIAVII